MILIGIECLHHVLRKKSEISLTFFFLLPISILANFYIAFVLQSNKSQLAM